ncbi:MAG: multiheme c-type cytochrome, partial [Thiohalomonadales bacterium]
MKTYKTIRSVPIWVAIITLVACGGGGDSGGTPPPDIVNIVEVNDLVPPTLSISGPTNLNTYATNNSSININGIAADDQGITDISWVNNRGGTGSIAISENWFYNNLSLQPGENIISVTVTDGGANSATDNITISYNVVDNNAPQISVTSPNNNGTFNIDINKISIAGTSTDNIAVKEVRWQLGTINGTATGTDPWIVNDIPLAIGNNQITVSAYDNANNSSTDTVNIIYQVVANSESCMNCHNGSDQNDYAGVGITNPHPFAGAQNIRCTICHGGDGASSGKDQSHVPPPPQIGDDDNLINNPLAYFNRLTLTGIDAYPDYVVGNKNYSALDYLQFVNPGDLRVVSQGKSCGRCHGNRHVAWVMKSPIATSTGLLGGATSAVGIENAIPAHVGKYNNTASDLAFRALINPQFNPSYLDNGQKMGAIGRLLQFPVMSQFGVEGRFNLYNNLVYDANNLTNDLYTVNELNGTKTNAIKANSNLADLYQEQVAFTCGNCHLGSAGANNRF